MAATPISTADSGSLQCRPHRQRHTARRAAEARRLVSSRGEIEGSSPRSKCPRCSKLHGNGSAIAPTRGQPARPSPLIPRGRTGPARFQPARRAGLAVQAPRAPAPGEPDPRDHRLGRGRGRAHSHTNGKSVSAGRSSGNVEPRQRPIAPIPSPQQRSAIARLAPDTRRPGSASFRGSRHRAAERRRRSRTARHESRKPSSIQIAMISMAISIRDSLPDHNPSVGLGKARPHRRFGRAVAKVRRSRPRRQSLALALFAARAPPDPDE